MMDAYTILCVTLIIVTSHIITQVRSERTATQCAGRLFSLTCGSEDYIIHVLYESYSYNPTQTVCKYNSSHCSGAEFINPVSAQHCNGNSQCSFGVTAGHRISTCNHNATAMTVFYSCILKKSMIDICSPYSKTDTQIIHLKSPDYPKSQLEPTNCFCNVTGRNITAEVYEHQKSNNSSTVFIFVTNKATIHINNMIVRNKILFSGMDDVKMVLDNRHQTELFKFWLRMSGSDMNVSCMGHPVAPKQTTLNPTTSDTSYHIETSFYGQFSTDLHDMTTFSFEFQSTVFPTSYLNILPTNSMSFSDTTQSLTSDLLQTVTPSTSFHQASSSTIPKEVNTAERKSNDKTDLRIIIVSVCVVAVVIIIAVSLAILIFRRKQRENRWDTQPGDDREEDIYHAYNYTFKNKYEED